MWLQTAPATLYYLGAIWTPAGAFGLTIHWAPQFIICHLYVDLEHSAEINDTIRIMYGYNCCALNVNHADYWYWNGDNYEGDANSELHINQLHIARTKTTK